MRSSHIIGYCNIDTVIRLLLNYVLQINAGPQYKAFIMQLSRMPHRTSCTFLLKNKGGYTCEAEWDSPFGITSKMTAIVLPDAYAK